MRKGNHPWPSERSDISHENTNYNGRQRNNLVNKGFKKHSGTHKHSDVNLPESANNVDRTNFPTFAGKPPSARSRIPVRRNGSAEQSEPDRLNATAQKRHLDMIKINKHLLVGMKDSLLELSKLSEGLRKHVANVTEMHDAAYRLLTNLDQTFIMSNETKKCVSVTQGMKTDKNRVQDAVSRHYFPVYKRVLPKIKSANGSTNGSTAYSLPSIFKTNALFVKNDESEIFDRVNTGNIKKIAMKKTREKSIRVVNLPSCHNKMFEVHSSTEFKEEQNKSGKKVLKAERKQALQKRLRQLEAFQDAYILQQNKSTSKTDRQLKSEMDDSKECFNEAIVNNKSKQSAKKEQE